MSRMPEHLWRFPTRETIASLADRFSLPHSPDMQDWEWEVADADRIDEFLTVFLSGQLDEDQRFVLLETLIQSFDYLGAALHEDCRWPELLRVVEECIEVHIYTVWYWADLEGDCDDWAVRPYFREILGRHRSRFERAAE